MRLELSYNDMPLFPRPLPKDAEKFEGWVVGVHMYPYEPFTLDWEIVGNPRVTNFRERFWLEGKKAFTKKSATDQNTEEKEDSKERTPESELKRLQLVYHETFKERFPDSEDALNLMRQRIIGLKQNIWTEDGRMKNVVWVKIYKREVILGKDGNPLYEDRVRKAADL